MKYRKWNFGSFEIREYEYIKRSFEVYQDGRCIGRINTLSEKEYQNILEDMASGINPVECGWFDAKGYYCTFD